MIINSINYFQNANNKLGENGYRISFGKLLSPNDAGDQFERIHGKAIDMHAHTIPGPKGSLNEMIDLVQGFTRLIFVSNIEGANPHEAKEKGTKVIIGEITNNEQALADCSANPMFKPYALCQPGMGSMENIRGLLIKHPGRFLGLKFHPEYVGIPATHSSYYPYMELARQHNLPCLFHTAPDVSDPAYLCKLAEKFPDVPIIFAHMFMVPREAITELPQGIKTRLGIPQYLEKLKKEKGVMPEWPWDIRELWGRECIRLIEKTLEKKPNAQVYVDVSWVKPETVVEAVKKLGADRVLFGNRYSIYRK